MCYPVCGMVHIKDPLLLIEKSSHLVAAAGFLNWAVYDRRLVVVTLLEVTEKEERVVTIHLSNGPLNTSSGLEPVPICEPCTYQPISR